MKIERRTLAWLAGILLLACDAATVRSPGARGAGGAEASGAGGPAGSPAGTGPSIDLPDAAAGEAGPGAVGQPPGPGERCAADVYSAEVAPLDLLLLVDSSGSMREPAGALSKWDMARGALAAFLEDPKSAGLGAGLQFFPFVAPKNCMSDADCGRPIVSRSCHVRGVCLGDNAPPPLAPMAYCDPGQSLCGRGSTCTPFGRCSLSGGDCLPVNDPCRGGVPGDTCLPVPRTCDPFVLDPAGSCRSVDYETPVVPIKDLPAAQTLLIAALDHKTPIGGTPMAAAVTGALAHLRKHVMANPGRRAVLVLATDGLPLNCATGNDIPTVAAALAAAHALAPALPTYVIGVFDPAALAGLPDALTMLAIAGGTGKPFVLTPGDDLTQKLLDSLNQIRGAALACEFRIPAAMMGQLDYGKVNVRITAPAGVDDLLYVARADRCDPMRGGWFYDVEPGKGTPTRVLTCPASCARLKDPQDPQQLKDLKVELLFGCQSRVD